LGGVGGVWGGGGGGWYGDSRKKKLGKTNEAGNSVPCECGKRQALSVWQKQQKKKLSKAGVPQKKFKTEAWRG